MTERFLEGSGESVNEELRSYESFPAILSLLRRGELESNRRRPQQEATDDVRVLVDEVRAAVIPLTEEERVARERLVNAITSDPELADVMERLREVNERLRTRSLADLSGGLDVQRAEQDVGSSCRLEICGGHGVHGHLRCLRARRSHRLLKGSVSWVLR